MKQRYYTCLLVPLILLGASCSYLPDVEGDPRLEAGFTGGFAGSGVEEVWEQTDTGWESEGKNLAEMEPSAGAFASFLVPVHDHMSVGGRFAYFSFLHERHAAQGWKRNWVFAGEGLTRFRFKPWELPSNIFVTIPIGVGVADASEDLQDEFGVEEAGMGWKFGLLGGMDYRLTERVGIFGEFGWRGQLVRFNPDDDQSEFYVDASFQQFVFNVGLMFPL